MNLVAIIIMGSGILIALVSLPLIQGKVPPNRAYGIRTKYAFASTENWYQINNFGGKVFLGVALLITLVGLFGLFLPSEDMSAYGIGAAIITFVSVLIATVIITTAFASKGK
jgi:uncharacterized membrane protein